jgi:hypothetical protein
VRLVSILILCLVAAPVLAGEVAGVTMAETVTVSGKTLRLNGMGLRTKFFFKAYVAGLYLETPTRSAETAITSDQVKRIHLRILRDLTRSQVSEAIIEGFQKNSRAQMPALKERLDRLVGLIPNLSNGDQVVMTYFPGKGTAFAVQGVQKGIIEGKDFADALFAVWLGREPAQPDLKRALLKG